MENTIIDKLILVQKPASYTGGECNSIVKEKVIVRAAVCYPDLYEIGMANNGIQILYSRANELEDAACERVFAPGTDMFDLLKKEDAALFTLETHTPLNKLDLLGFNLSHELLFSNVLMVLDSGKIPLLSRDRSETDPIIMAGGSCASNPFPMADFVDVFFAGDGEDGFPQVLKILAEGKKRGLSRNQLIMETEKADGVLLPRNYSFEYRGRQVLSVTGPVVRKQSWQGTEPSDPVRPVVPSIRTSQDRAVMEISRGCFNLCKFCHAGYYDLPYRAYDHTAVAAKIRELLASTGYNELTLSSLSVGDYRHLVPLLNEILPELTEHGVSVSLPSLKVDKNTLPVIKCISDVRRSSLTFAVESGSPEIRALAHKRVREEELLQILEHVFENGWNLVKLYFMLGLPGCDQTDEASAVIELLKKINSLPNRRKEIHVTLSPFIPKVHTPFQRAVQKDSDYFLEQTVRIKQSAPRCVKIKSHNIRASVLEGVFSRGDARLGEVILAAYRKGCRFDSWTEHFRYDIWQECLNSILPWWPEYLAERSEDEILPWSVISTGREKLLAAMVRRTCCPAVQPDSIPVPVPDTAAFDRAMERFKEKYAVTGKVRLTLSRTGTAAYIPHIDFGEIIKRALRRAGVPVSFTQGFNKRERLTMGPALSVGVQSLQETVDADLYRETDFAVLPEKLTAFMPAGIRVLSAETPDPEMRLQDINAVSYEVTGSPELMAKAAENLLMKPSFIKKGKKCEKEIPFDEAVLSYSLKQDETLCFTLKAGQEGSMRMDSIMLQLLNAENIDVSEFKITKTGQHILR